MVDLKWSTTIPSFIQDRLWIYLHIQGGRRKRGLDILSIINNMAKYVNDNMLYINI